MAVIGEGGVSSWSLIDSEMHDDLQLIAAAGSAPATGSAPAAAARPAAQAAESDSEEESVDVISSGRATTMPTAKEINLSKAVKRTQKKKKKSV